VVDARIAVGVPTAVAVVPIAAGAPAGLDSNAVPAAQGMTAVTRVDIPARRAAPNSFPRC
jgi:hypothetical protein